VKIYFLLFLLSYLFQLIHPFCCLFFVLYELSWFVELFVDWMFCTGLAGLLGCWLDALCNVCKLFNLNYCLCALACRSSLIASVVRVVEADTFTIVLLVISSHTFCYFLRERLSTCLWQIDISCSILTWWGGHL
jgi:hypothetical protein